MDDGQGAPSRNAKIRGVTVDLPDPDWYLDNVILPAGQGPVAARQSAWLGVGANARVHACGSAADLVESALRQGFVATRTQARDLGMPDADVRRRDDELWKEKRRQERIERLGFRVVRVLWADVVDHPDETAARIRAALCGSRSAAGPTRI